jgi:transcriptional regulator with XRE-family HTH domain
MGFSEKLLIEDLTHATQRVKELSKGLSLGVLIRMIRTQIGMSQEVLSKKAGVPQSTISRIERGSKDANLSTLHKILHALSCELVIVPKLLEPVDSIRKKQARKRAQARVQYLKGTMNLEGQEPDAKFINALIDQEEQRLLQESNSSLWSDD